MSTEQHEALKHAALLNAEAWPAHMTLHKWADIAGSTIRTQHALIVQMAEALELAINAMASVGESPSKASIEKVANQACSESPLGKARDSHAAATQYLTRGPKT